MFIKNTKFINLKLFKMTQSLTSIQRFYRYYLLLIAIVAISCKKQADFVDVSQPDQSASSFVKELYAKWTAYSKDHPVVASLKPNEQLDWKNIVIRISTNAERSINYYVAVTENNQPCVKALELSFSSEKNNFQANMRNYTAPSPSAGSSSEERRLQTILYNFSMMGLTIPQNIINQEKIIQKKLNDEHIASARKKQCRSLLKIDLPPHICLLANVKL